MLPAVCPVDLLFCALCALPLQIPQRPQVQCLAGKGRFWHTFLSVLVWNLCYFGVLLALLAVILLLALLAMHIIHGSSFIPPVRCRC